MTLHIKKQPPIIRKLTDQERTMDEWLLQRLEQLLPSLMKKHNIDMWVTIGKEYHEDPIGVTFFPSSIDSSRRLTIFVFVKEKNSETITRYVVSSNNKFEPFYTCYPSKNGEDSFHVLNRIMDDYSPRAIAVNSSKHYAFCDGLTQSLHEILRHSIGEAHFSKLVSSEKLAIDWLQTRTEPELDAYKELVSITKTIVEETFTNQVIKPNVSSTYDVVAWIRQRVVDLGIKTSFYPTLDIQRRDADADRIEGTILPGDILHLDFGIEYLGLCTDTQQLAYVLKTGETEVPAGLRSALHTAAIFEDIFFETCKKGMSGNDVFSKVIENATNKGITAMLYSHPIGYHCHGAGPLIGLYDKQEPISFRGELPLEEHTCYALEFNIRKFIPEWNKDIPIYLEETVSLKDNEMCYFTERQTEFYLIHSDC